MRRWPVVWLASLSALCALAAEWMRSPGLLLAVGALASGLLAATAAGRAAREGRSGAWALWSGALLSVVVGLGAAAATAHLWRVERRWPETREAIITAASARLAAAVNSAADLARSLADGGAPGLQESRSEAFARLSGLVRRSAPSHGVTLYTTGGQPYAWAGSQRAALPASGPELDILTTPFYLWLLARRHEPSGSAVGAVLLARRENVPRALRAVADDFVEKTDAGLTFYAPRTAPADPDVFDYVLPNGDTLFAVAPLPPEQAAIRAAALSRYRRLAAIVVAALVLLAALGAARTGLPAPLPVAPAAALLLFVGRAPLAEAFGASSIFRSDTYAYSLLGPFSASSGALLLLGLVSTILAVALWRRGLKPSFWSGVLALGVTLLAPYLMQDLARGIRPPAGGVPAALWLTWQMAMVLAASALVLFAAALVRGDRVPGHMGPRPIAAGAIALGLAALGLWLWEPVGAWPDWYPYLWLPALLLAIRPMPLRGTLATVAVVAGSAAALLTWGATAEGRVARAGRDVGQLGDQPDSRVQGLLEDVVREHQTTSRPASAGDLLVYWQGSPLGAAGRAASLAVWTPDGRRQLTLDLANLDLPVGMVAAAALEAAGRGQAVVRSHVRVPGVYGIAAIPLRDSTILTVVAGPASRLVAPTRVARWLLGEAEEPEPLYDLALSPPEPSGPSPTNAVSWRRVAWTVRGERVLALPGGSRHVHASVDLGGASALLQRGTLVLLLDVFVLGLLWLLAESVEGRAWPYVRERWRRAARSLRVRLTVSLALFFLLPTFAFAAWSYARLNDEVRRARELLIQRTLRDAGSMLASQAVGDSLAVLEASRRVDSELFLTRGGVLVATSAPVLADLGFVDRLVPADGFTRLVLGDELEVALGQREPGLLVGYRLLGRGEASSAAVLAAPEFLDDVTLRRRERELGIAVMVASALGVLAALVLSGVAARALARPVQRLREAALAVGSGEFEVATGERLAAGGQIPTELEPVHAAIAQAAADVEAAQRAQRVLAWGEMARQVAHEVKNPLTPIRLGIQHLLRLNAERPAELGAALPGTGQRILGEIERLDAIARAFSRFAAPEAADLPRERLDLSAVARHVHDLYRAADGPPAWVLEAADPVFGLARRDELVEVLVNLCENARDAQAGRVTIRVSGTDAAAVVNVEDDGRGIPEGVLPRVFEPRFSTTTSGSGLGLAIAKKLVESWGGGIAITSVEGKGTSVTVRLAPAPSTPSSLSPSRPAGRQL